MDQELVQYLDTRFHIIDQRFQSINERFQAIDARFETIDRRFDIIDARFEGMDARFQSMEERIEQRFDEVKRHTGVLVEGLRQEVHLVAEGLIMHVEVRHREDREYFDRKFEDMSVLFRSSHDHLQQQQDQLRHAQDQIHQRVENLERNQN